MYSIENHNKILRRILQTNNPNAIIYEQTDPNIFELIKENIDRSIQNCCDKKYDDIINKKNPQDTNFKLEITNDLMRTVLFNIYDNNNILNVKYGSTPDVFNNFLLYFKNFIKEKQMPDIIFSTKNDMLNSNFNHQLISFFRQPHIRNGFFQIGTLNHGVLLYLSKIKIETYDFTKVVYINTGYGMDVNTLNNVINGKKYYNLFKTIYLHPILYKSFIYFLQPLLFKSIYSNKIDMIYALNMYIYDIINSYFLTQYHLILNDADKIICKHFFCNGIDINEWYEKMFFKLDSDDYFYEYLNNIFDFDKFKQRIEQFKINILYEINYEERMNYTKSELFSQFVYNIKNIMIIINKEYEDYYLLSKKLPIIWQTETKKYLDTIENDFEKQYLIKSFENLNFYYDIKSNKLVFELQKAGTCVFKSSLYGVLYYFVFYLRNDPNILTDFYNKFSSYCFSALNKYINSENHLNDIYNETINSINILEILYNDKIIPENKTFKYMLHENFNNVIDNKKEFTYKEISNIRYIIPDVINFSIIPLEIVNNLIYKMRNNNLSVDVFKGLLIQLYNEYVEKYMHQPKSFFVISALVKAPTNYIYHARNDLILLALLGEYYFNKEKWSHIDSKYAFNNIYICDIFELTQIRVPLTNLELDWISYFTNFFNKIDNVANINYFYKNANILSIIFTNINQLYLINKTYNKEEFILLPIFNVYYNFSKQLFYTEISNINAINLYINYNFLNKQTKSNINSTIKNINYLYGENITNLYSFIITHIKNNCNFILIIDYKLIFSYISILNMFHNFLTYKEKYDYIKSLFISIKNLNEYDIYIKACLLINLLLDDVFLIYESDNIINYYIDNNGKTTKNGYSITKELFYLILNLFQTDVVNDNNIINAIKSIKINLDYSFIKNIDDNNIEYIIDNQKYTNKISKLNKVNESFNDFILLKLISSKSNNIYLTDKHIIFEAEINIDALSTKIIFYAFEINIVNDKFIISNKYIYINSKKYKLSDNKKKYTFISVLPYLTINFISFDDNNNISTHSVGIDNASKLSQLYECIFNRQTPFGDELYPALIELEIKPNYLIPYIDEKYYNYINYEYKFYKKHSNLLDKFNYQELANFNSDQQLILLPSIKKIISINDTNINEILNDIINHNLVEKENLDLIKWINISKYSPDYGKKNNVCETDCSKTHTIGNKIDNFLIILKKIRKYVANKCSHDMNYKLLDFIKENYAYCTLLMQTNIYISKLLRLNEIIKDCIKLSCHEIAEINELFIRQNDNIELLSAMVEIVFGNIIRIEQWDKIYNIYFNYQSSISNIYEHNRIHQFMMGKGKSSLITPMLTVLLFNENVNIVVPEHLIKQTKETIYEFKHFFGINPNILSDTDIKLLFLEENTSNTKFNNNIYLIDEFDYMYNPLQSNFNIIEESRYIDTELIDKIFNIVNLFLNNKIDTDYPKYSLEKNIISILTNKSYVKYKNYGMSVKFNYRYCIPYLRKDSPNEGSQFSSNIITMVLTILYFYDKDRGFILEEKDIRTLFTKSKLILKKILAYFDINNFISLEDVLYKFNEKINNKIYSIPANVFLEYLYVVLSELNESTIIRNCSFVDIINMNSKWQVGYSGTVNVNLEIEPIIPWNKYNMKVIEDPDEKNNVINALNYNQQVYSINQNSYDILFNKLINYDVVIDACSYFKDIDNTLVAKRLYEMSNKPVIYLLKDDTKMIYNNKPNKYVYYPYKTGEVIYYYSHRHIIGIDFKQPVLLNGVVILDKNNKYTEVAQAIYRMRKLNKGHTINIIMVDKYKWNASEIVYLLQHNETIYENNVKPLLNYQYLKYFVRKFITHNYYETDLTSLYDMPEQNIKNNKLIKNICKKKIMNNIVKMNYRETYKYRYYINELYKQIKKESLDVLVNLVFNLETTQVNIKKQITTEEEVEEEVEEETEAVVQISSLAQKTIQRINPYKVLYFMHPYKSVKEFEEFVYLKIKLEQITLMFSVNLANNLGCNNECILVELEKDIYLVDSSISMDHYILNRPIYNLDGYLINKYIFKNDKYIDFKKIFNFSLMSNESNDIIPICDILFDTYSSHTKNKKPKSSSDKKRGFGVGLDAETYSRIKICGSFRNCNLIQLSYGFLYNRDINNDINIIIIDEDKISQDKFEINNTIYQSVNIDETEIVIVPKEIIVKLKILIALSKADVFNKFRPYMQQLKESGNDEIDQNLDNVLINPSNIGNYYFYIKDYYENVSKEKLFNDNSIIILGKSERTLPSLKLIFFQMVKDLEYNINKSYYFQY